MLKFCTLAFIVCSLSAQVFASPLNPVSVRDIKSKRNSDIPIVDLHIVNKNIAPDGYEREYVYLFKLLLRELLENILLLVLFLPEGHFPARSLQGTKYILRFTHLIGAHIYLLLLRGINS